MFWNSIWTWTASKRNRKENVMLDLAYVGLAALLFGLSFGMIKLFEIL